MLCRAIKLGKDRPAGCSDRRCLLPLGYDSACCARLRVAGYSIRCGVGCSCVLHSTPDVCAFEEDLELLVSVVGLLQVESTCVCCLIVWRTSFFFSQVVCISVNPSHLSTSRRLTGLFCTLARCVGIGVMCGRHVYLVAVQTSVVSVTFVSGVECFSRQKMHVCVYFYVL